MNLYDFLMWPLEKFLLANIRKSLISNSSGNVLELGIGTGVNLPYYDPSQISALTGLDIKLTKKILNKSRNSIALFQGSAEKLPFPDGSFDTVVATLLLCSVKDFNKAICEIKRVLKENGTYIFIEHIEPEKKALAVIFNTLNKIWPVLINGCNLNRKTDIAIQKKRFLFPECPEEMQCDFLLRNGRSFKA